MIKLVYGMELSEGKFLRQLIGVTVFQSSTFNTYQRIDSQFWTFQNTNLQDCQFPGYSSFITIGQMCQR